MSEFSLQCSSCKKSSPLCTSTSVTKRGTSYDVNRRAVYFSIETGSGYESLLSFCSIMNMPCMSKTAYYKQVDNILEALEDEAEEQMKKAGERLRQHILNENPSKSKDETLEAAVSFDGTWAKRGFTSLTGVVFVISVDTGEILDYHVISKTCKKCEMKKVKCDNDDEFQEWLLEHHDCDINFAGSSPAMESEGAVVMWKRSVERHNLQYKWMVSDGDSKAFSAVENIYGDEITVEKLDCVGHVQKRMGKHLLNLKARTKGKLADGHPIGGRGRLTEVKIKQLQKYYGLAIRQNTISKSSPSKRDVDLAVYAMKKNIIAILHHRVKLEDCSKQHRFCPPGESSWCKWQQDKTSGTSTYTDEGCLPGVFLKVLKPTFMTLSDTKLLERCVLGATQNRNERVNSMVWVRCPKHKHHGVKVIRCAVASAVCHYHTGAASRLKVLERLNTPRGASTRQAAQVKDQQRMKKSDL